MRDERRGQLRELEALARQLEPSAEQRAAWNGAVQAYADEFIDALPGGMAFQPDEEQGRLLQDLSFEEEPRELGQLLQILRKEVDRPGINPASGGHLGYIPGGGVFPTALGDYLAAVTNRYAGIFFANPGAVRIENSLIHWMCRMVGYPETALGNLASGGSIANLIAITTARDAKGIRPRVVEKAVVYLTEQVHHCVQKALRIAGLEEAIIRYVPMDGRYRMDAGALRRQVAADQSAGLRPFLVVGSAGTTDTGSIDPLADIADIAGQHDLWFHVDAAYGGFFALLDELRPAFRGMERSDSLAIDPHKGLFLSYGLGAVLIKDVQAQLRSHYYRANYMQDSVIDTDELNPADLSPELTKHFRGLRMWMALQLFGLTPFRAALQEKRELALYFHEEVQKLGFEVGPSPELSVAIYRYVPLAGDPDDFNRRLVARVQRDGRVFVSSTLIQGRFWIRLAVLSFRTHLEHIDWLLEVLEAGVRELEA